MKDYDCADCGGYDLEWMYRCEKHDTEWCRGCSCPDCDEDNYENEEYYDCDEHELNEQS